MEYKFFESRLSTYQKPATIELYQNQRESFAINLRKSKRQTHFNKYRTTKTFKMIPRCVKVPESLSHHSSFHSSISTLADTLNSKKDEQEVLLYIYNILSELSEFPDTPGLAIALINSIGAEIQTNFLCCSCLLEYSYLCNVPRLLESEISTVLGIKAGVNLELRMKICYNLLDNWEYQEEELNLMIKVVFEGEIDGGRLILEVIERFVEVTEERKIKTDLLPGLEWLLQVGIRTDELQSESVGLIYRIVKTLKRKKYTKLLVVHDILYLLADFIADEKNDPIVGLGLLNLIHKKYYKTLDKQTLDNFWKISYFLQHPNYKVKRLTFSFLCTALGSFAVKPLITPDLLRTLVSNLSNSENQLQVLKFANTLILKFKLTETLINEQIFKHLSCFTELTTNKKLSSEFIGLCNSLIQSNPEFLTDFEQSGLFEVLETIELSTDKHTEDLYQDIMILKPDYKVPLTAPMQTFIFS